MNEKFVKSLYGITVQYKSVKWGLLTNKSYKLI